MSELTSTDPWVLFTHEQLDRIFRGVMSREEAMRVCDGIRELLARDRARTLAGPDEGRGESRSAATPVTAAESSGPASAPDAPPDGSCCWTHYLSGGQCDERIALEPIRECMVLRGYIVRLFTGHALIDATSEDDARRRLLQALAEDLSLLAVEPVRRDVHDG